MSYQFMPLLPGLDGGPVHLFLHNQHITHRPDNCDWCIPPSLQCSANICVNNPTDSPFEAGRIQERLSLGVRVPVRTAYPLYTVISHNWLCQNNRENDTVMATMTHDIIPALISLPCLCSVITSTYRTFIFYPPFKLVLHNLTFAGTCSSRKLQSSVMIFLGRF